jgi:hypothetical protein
LPPQSCSFRYDGEQKTIKHGGSWTFKPYYTAMDANYCSEITATCYDGEMKVNEDDETVYGYGYGSCYV